MPSDARRLLLGVDTGGTYTDAVLVDPTDDRVVAAAKARTFHDDLATGIAEAIDAVLAEAGRKSSSVGLVSLSTTLATNALVEGRGGRVCLVLAGFDDNMVERAGLADAARHDRVVRLEGGHDSAGTALAPLDLETAAAAIMENSDSIDAFAVCSQFAVRNTEHERALRDLVLERSERPVTCSHELSSRLNGPKRALTTLLNARLIGLIDQLGTAARAILRERSIEAPLMMVKGDGSLVSDSFTRRRPIETILSGPASSIIAAAHLSGIRDGVVSDIGGTTTDIAVIRDGRPRLDPQGALVGGHRTMVEAVATHTHGLGGDSEVMIDERPLANPVILGPRRLEPVSRLARDHPELVHDALDHQLADKVTPAAAARFLTPTAGAERLRSTLGAREIELLDAIGSGPTASVDIAPSFGAVRTVRRLIARGVVREAGFTPTDAAHVLGRYSALDREAATKAARLIARRTAGTGLPVASSAEQLAEMVLYRLERRSAESILQAGFVTDGLRIVDPERSELVAEVLEPSREEPPVTRIDIGVAMPLIALGASAATYYPAIGARIGADTLVPEHADVANALGAVIGHVRRTEETRITQPRDGRFRVHDSEATRDFSDLDEAVDWGRTQLVARVARQADAAGAADTETTVSWDPVTATIAAEEIFVEGVLTASAIGRPRVI